MVDRTKLMTDVDVATTEFLAKVDGIALVSIIALNDGTLMIDKYGQGMVTDIQMAALEAAAAVLTAITKDVGQVEMLRSMEGPTHGKTVRPN